MSETLYFPELTSFKTPVTISPEDIMLKSPTEAGYIITRPRFTKARKDYQFSWDLNEEEIFTFLNFYDTDCFYGTKPFWIDFYLNEHRINAYVMFASVPEIVYNGIGTWEVKCKFKEL